MDKKIFDSMEELKNELGYNCKWVNYDFECDKDYLQKYEGEFIWLLGTFGTYIMPIAVGHIENSLNNEGYRYSLAQKSVMADGCLAMTHYKFIHFKDDGSYVFITPEQAAELWEKNKEEAVENFKKKNGFGLPTDMKIRVRFSCDWRYVLEQLRYAREHGDDSLMDCLKRSRHCLKLAKDHEMMISSDFSHRSFLFADVVNGKVVMNGGIIFHGYPEEGYMQNGSVQLTPSYGWQIHT